MHLDDLITLLLAIFLALGILIEVKWLADAFH